MTKEEYIEQWIEQNNPYEVEVYPDPMDPFMFLGGIEDDTKKKMWKEGAMAMANNLTNQPPTKELLKKIFNISKRCPMGDVEEDGEYHSYLGFDGFCEYIIKHWDNE